MLKISVITATYNSGVYLEDSIKSVIQQKDDNLEYIIIDGGSKDNTVDIIKKYSQYISYWVSERDNGIYDAWNKGVKKATGDWILFIGGDDFLKPDAIKLYRDFIVSNNISKDCLYISSKMELIDEQKKLIRVMGWAWEWDVFKRINATAHPGSLHSSELFKQYGYYDDTNYKICGDYELLLRPKEKLNAAFLDAVTTQMTFGGASTNPKMLKESYSAVVNTAHTSKILAKYDYYRQYFKMSIKNYFRKFGINLVYRK